MSYKAIDWLIDKGRPQKTKCPKGLNQPSG